MIQIPQDIFTTQPKYKYGKASLERLETCHPHLQLICRILANYQDTSVLCGHRTKMQQNLAFTSTPQRSKVRWPNSKHNEMPSIAVDISPYPIDWQDLGRFRVQAGRVLQIADMLEIDIRWGGDWDRDTYTNDQKFQDLPHFELPNPGFVDLDKIMEGYTA